MHHHSQPCQVLLEEKLLNLLVDYKKGSSAAAEDILNLLTKLTGSDIPGEVVALLTSMLALEDDMVRSTVAGTLASLREDAASAVSMLKRLALTVDENDLGSVSAIRALGCIPGEASIESLVCVVEGIESMDSPKVEHTVDALAMHREALSPYLPRVEKALGKLQTGDEDFVSQIVNRLRCVVRWSEYEALGELTLPGEFDFSAEGLSEDGTPNLEWVEHRELPAGYGLIVDERIRFVRHGRGDVGLEIYRLNRNGDRYLVILSDDERSGTACVSDAVEYLATTTCALYGLDPERTVWAERVTFESGLLDNPEDEYSIIEFQELERATLRFRLPRSERLASRQELFERA